MTFILLCSTYHMVYANTAADTIMYKADDYGFNATTVNQGRLKHKDRNEFVNDNIIDHLSLGLSASYLGLDNWGQYSVLPGLSYGGYIQKSISKTQSFRLSLDYGRYEIDEKIFEIRLAMLGLSNIYDWTSMFKGYDENRKTNISSTLTLGYFRSNYNGNKYSWESTMGPYLKLGTQVRFRINPKISLNLEPYFGVANDKIDFSEKSNLHKYDYMYGFTTSIAYNLGDDNGNLNHSGSSPYENLFVDLYSGTVCFPIENHSLFESMGPQMGIGLGYWIEPNLLGVKVSGNLSSNGWRILHTGRNDESLHPAYDKIFSNLLFNGRLDILLNPLAYINTIDLGNFGVNIVGGWEYGGMIKNDITTDGDNFSTRLYYNGYSGAIRLKWDYDRNQSLYIEPRLTFANYSIPYIQNNGDGYTQLKSAKHYTDLVYGICLGLELNSFDKESNKVTSDDDSHLNNHRLNVGLSLGLNNMMNIYSYKGKPIWDYSLTASGGYKISPYSAARASVGMYKYSFEDLRNYNFTYNHTLLRTTGLWHEKYLFLEVSADYLFDIKRCLVGDRQDPVSVDIAVGPIVSFKSGSSSNMARGEGVVDITDANPVIVQETLSADIALGASIGIPIGYNINSHWSITIEPKITLFDSEFINNGLAGDMTKILNIQLGTKYSF